MADEIIFLGSNHCYPHLIEATNAFLEWQRPDGIVFELDEERFRGFTRPLEVQIVEARERYQNANRDTLRWCLGMVKAECEAIDSYRRQHRIPLVLADDSCMYAEMTKSMIKRSKRRLYSLPLHEAVEQGFDMSCTIDEELIPDMLMRDAAMERHIRRLPGRIVALNGLGHVFGEYTDENGKHPNLYDRFADLRNRRRYRIDDAHLLSVEPDAAAILVGMG